MKLRLSLPQGFDAPFGGKIGSSLPRGLFSVLPLLGFLFLVLPFFFDDANTLLDGASDRF